jgi:beta-galactosidase
MKDSKFICYGVNARCLRTMSISAAMVLALVLAVAPRVWAAAEGAGRERLLMDTGWRFHFGNLDDAREDFGFGTGQALAKASRANNTSSTTFNDRDWTPVNLPHDWAVGLPFDQSADKDHGFKPLGRKFPATSVGWYRRGFVIPASDKGRRVWLEFDGVFRDCHVWVNRNLVGRNDSGYIGFRCDLTDYLNYGGTNVVSVRVDASQEEGWFYEGAGIYRHVWLVKTSPLHVAHWGTYVTSEVNGKSATVTARARVVNEGAQPARFDLASTVLDIDGKTVATKRVAKISLESLEEREITMELPVREARLWSLDSPNLYTLVTAIDSGGSEVDRYETPFGIRTIKFDPDNGFFLNGQRVEIKGDCNHQDHAGLGSALPDRVQYFRVEKLKELGANAYRTSHNPPTPELLDACDRLGMLVMDEVREVGSSPEALSQLERMLLRDRNHPSIFIWSLGNEEPIQGTELGTRIMRTMKAVANRLDPTLLTTVAMNNSWGRGFSGVVDVQGFNYKHQGSIDGFHERFPKQPTMGSEEASTLATRGIYANDKQRGYMSAYDVNAPSWGATAESWWMYYATRPFLAGAFVWTGFDYRGEPTPYSWPCISSHFGVMDTCGFPKDDFYYYQAWWTDKPMLHLLPHWNWPGKEGQEIDVWAMSNCEEVELWLNGQSLGRQSMKPNSHLEWKVKYAPGTLLARGFKGGKEIATNLVETTGAPAAVKLTPDQCLVNADGEDVSMVMVSVVDAQGRIVPVADNEVSFEVTPSGAILGVGNGDPSSHEADKATQRKVFNGLAQVIVQSSKQSGPIELKATSPDLQSASVTIDAKACIPRACVP